MAFVDFPSRLDRGDCCSGPLDKAEAQLIAHEWILNKFEKPFSTLSENTGLLIRHPVFFLVFFCEDYSRIPITEHLPEIPGRLRLCRPIETAKLSGSSAQTVWNRFLRLGKTASQPAKILPGQRAVTQRLSEILFTEPQFVIAEQIQAGVGRAHTRKALQPNIITQLQSHNVHCCNDNTQRFFPFNDALF